MHTIIHLAFAENLITDSYGKILTDIKIRELRATHLNNYNIHRN